MQSKEHQANLKLGPEVNSKKIIEERKNNRVQKN
ncbi:hypothetical protein BH18THE2_BH18THE2_07550 [soil metagenome]